MARQKPITAGGPTFGMILRGARLGYRWTPQHGAFIRMSLPSVNKLAVQLHPPQLIDCPRGRQTPSEYLVWWEKPSLLPALIEEVPWLGAVRRVKRPVYFEVSYV